MLQLNSEYLNSIMKLQFWSMYLVLYIILYLFIKSYISKKNNICIYI